MPCAGPAQLEGAATPAAAAHDWPEQTCSRHPRGKRRTPVPPDQPSVAQALALDSRRASRAVAGDNGASQLCAPHAACTRVEAISGPVRPGQPSHHAGSAASIIESDTATQPWLVGGCSHCGLLAPGLPNIETSRVQRDNPDQSSKRADHRPQAERGAPQPEALGIRGGCDLSLSSGLEWHSTRRPETNHPLAQQGPSQPVARLSLDWAAASIQIVPCCAAVRLRRTLCRDSIARGSSSALNIPLLGPPPIPSL